MTSDPASARAVFLLTALLVACGDDGDCEWTLDEWCDEVGDCDGYATYDEGLTTLFTDPYALVGARSCDNGTVLHVGDGYVGKVFTYDAKSGLLTGAANYADVLQEGCDYGNSSAGDAHSCFEGCTLLVDPQGLDHDDEVCTGAVAEPLIAACMDDPPASVAGCEACACPACYPILAQCVRPDAADGAPHTCDGEGTIECLENNCADACADQLVALGEL